MLAISAIALFCLPHGLVPQDFPLQDIETLLRAALAMKVVFVSGVSLTKVKLPREKRPELTGLFSFGFL